MLGKQDRAMRAAYQDWAKRYRLAGIIWLAKEAVQCARKYHTEG